MHAIYGYKIITKNTFYNKMFLSDEPFVINCNDYFMIYLAHTVARNNKIILFTLCLYYMISRYNEKPIYGLFDLPCN